MTAQTDRFKFPSEIPEVGQKVQVLVMKTGCEDNSCADPYNIGVAEEGIVISRCLAMGGFCILLQHHEKHLLLYDEELRKWKCDWVKRDHEARVIIID